METIVEIICKGNVALEFNGIDDYIDLKNQEFKFKTTIIEQPTVEIKYGI